MKFLIIPFYRIMEIKQEDGIEIINFNINGLDGNKRIKLNSLLIQKKPDIVAISETHLKGDEISYLDIYEKVKIIEVQEKRTEEQDS